MATKKKPDAPPLPIVVTNGRPDKDILADYISALTERQAALVFCRDRELVTLARTADGSYIIVDLDADGITYILEHATHTVTYQKAKDEGGRGKYIPSPVPLRIARMFLKSPYPFPPIRGISRAPVLRIDGTFITEPGYDAASQVYYDPAPGFTMPVIPDAPLPGEAALAAETIKDLLCDFPFATQADRANALGMAVTLIIRHAINGPVPMAIIDAISDIGSGKTKLADTLINVAIGKSLKGDTLPDEETEMRKTLLGAAAAGKAIMFFDNAKGTMGGSALEAAITLEGIAGRLLGGNKLVEDGSLRATWIVTGNGAHATRDMNRRSYPIILNAQTYRAYERTDFKYELPQEAKDNQGKYLGALMIMIRAWYAAGCPAGPVNPVLSGTFGQFVKMVGGILRIAGVSGFLDNVAETMVRRNDEDMQWYNHIRTLHQVTEGNAFTVSQLVKYYGLDDFNASSANTDLVETIPGSIAAVLDTKRSVMAKASSLGTFLSKRVGRRYGPEGFTLSELDSTDTGSKKRYRITTLESEKYTPPTVPTVTQPKMVFYTGPQCPKCKTAIPQKDVFTSSDGLRMATHCNITFNADKGYI